MSQSPNDGDVTGNHGSADYWVVKIGINGNIEWQKCLGGSDSEIAFSIAQNNDNGFIVAGYSSSNDGDVSGNHGDEDYWIVRLNENGNIIWQKSLGGTKFDRANAAQQTVDGGFIVAGYSRSNDGDVSGNHGLYDVWVVKLNEDGNLEWQKSLGGTSDDAAWIIRPVSDGGFILAGYSESNDGDVTGNHGTSDFWIVKLGANGNLVWQKCFGGSDFDSAYDILQVNDGGFIVVGSSGSSDGDLSGNQGELDYWIVKIDTIGDLQWDGSLGGSDFDEAFSVKQTSDGGLIVAGLSFSSDGDVSENNGGADYWVVKLNSYGSLVWQKSLGGSDWDEGYSVQQSNDNGYVIIGCAFSNDGDISGNHGNTDIWTVKLSRDTITGIPSLSTDIISLFPNPVQNQLNISLSTQAEEYIVYVYNLQGKIILLPITFTNFQVQLNTTSLAEGFYTIRIINNETGRSEVGKFVKAQ